MRKLLKILICIAALTGLALMSVMIYHYREDASQRSAHIAELAALAKEYETELTQLKREQELQEMHNYVPEGPGAAVIAFRIGDEETLLKAQAYGQKYRFTPSVIVNVDDENVMDILALLSDSGMDIIFACNRFNTKTGAALKTVMEAEEELIGNSTRSFLLRSNDDTETNRRILIKNGIKTLFLYGGVLSTDVTDDFTELNYSYINRSGYSPTSRLSDLDRSEQGLLFAVDLVETTVTEKQLDDILDSIRAADEEGKITIGATESAVNVVRSRVESENEMRERFIATQDERLARIEELEAIIREIYSHWDD